MPKKCVNCDFFHPDNDLCECPECGQELKFTMFVPPSYQTEEAAIPEKSQAWNHEVAEYEQLELPWGVRWTQICTGIGIYCLISRKVSNIFFATCVLGADGVKIEKIAVFYLFCILFFYIIGALAGGAVAGAWSVNWLPQGLGVAAGVFLAPFVLYVCFGPVDGIGVLAFLLTIGLTTGLSVLGAWIGHKVVRPSRYVIS